MTGPLPYLLPIYVLATLFPNLLRLPYLPAQVQLTELLFPFVLLAYGRPAWRVVRQLPVLSLALAAYCATNVVAALWMEYHFPTRTAGAVAEAGGRCYLALLLPLTVAYLRQYGGRRLSRWWVYATAAVASLSLIVYAAHVAGWMVNNYWVTEVGNYPYFGRVWRLSGPANVYGMYAMLLLPGLCLAASRRRYLLALPIGLALLLTFAKENVLVFVALGVYLAAIARRPAVRRAGMVLALLATVFLQGITHLLLTELNGPVSRTAYTNGRVVWSDGQLALMETNYTENKRAAVLLAGRRPWLGYAPGQFGKWTEDLVAEGNYPANFGRFDPHSVWTGALVETGLLGLLALLFLVAIIWRTGSLRVSPVLGAILCCFLVASVFKDIMNFRQLWVLLGWWVSRVPSWRFLSDERPVA